MIIGTPPQILEMMKLLHRQILPLLLLYSNNRPVNGRTRMQKLVFLTEKKLDLDEYNFIPYNYGPFSKELYEDIDDLITENYIEETHEEIDGNVIFTYKLTPNGRELAEKLLLNPEFKKKYATIEYIKSNYCYLTLHTLIEKVYAEYPIYAINSIYEA